MSRYEKLVLKKSPLIVGGGTLKRKLCFKIIFDFRRRDGGRNFFFTVHQKYNIILVGTKYVV